MLDIEQIKDFEQIKIVSDPHRLAILRLLMAGPATLTQLGRVMGEHPAWVRHHLKQLEAAGLVEMKTAQVSGGFVEKYYRAKARAFYLQEMILPEASGKKIVVMLGSHDLALNALAQRSLENSRAAAHHPAGWQPGRAGSAAPGDRPDERLSPARYPKRRIQPALHPPYLPGPSGGAGDAGAPRAGLAGGAGQPAATSGAWKTWGAKT